MTSKQRTDDYKVIKLKSSDIDDNLLAWFYACNEDLKMLYDLDYDVACVDYRYHADVNHLWICIRNNFAVGFLFATNGHSFFNPSNKSLTQRILYAVPKTRAANLLLKEYIDFGKSSGKSIYTVLGLATNIKSKTLEKMGFKYVESLYRMEV